MGSLKEKSKMLKSINIESFEEHFVILIGKHKHKLKLYASFEKVDVSAYDGLLSAEISVIPIK